MKSLQPSPLFQRVAAVDAYRGFVMFLMMAEILHLSGLASQFPDSAVWQLVGFNTSHVEWTGCSLHDLIQPSFSFLVGVALPYSIAARMVRGQAFARMFSHALWRSLLLIALGIFLRFDRPEPDQLYLRGHADPDWFGLPVLVPTWLPQLARTGRGFHLDSLSDTGLPLRSTRCRHRTSTLWRLARPGVGRTT